MFAVPDMETLRLCSLLNSLAFGGLFLFLWQGRRADRYFLYWGGSSLLYAAVILLFAGTRFAPLWLSTVFYALLALSNLMPVMGLRCFEGRLVYERWMVLPLMVAAGCHALPRLLVELHWIDPVRSMPGALDMVGLGVAMAINGGMLASGPSRGQRLAGWAMLAYLPAFASALLAEVLELGASNPLEGAPLIADQLLLGMINLGLLAIPFDRAQHRLREAALRDPLTGVWNRAGLAAQRGALLAPGASLIAIDVDHFKQINDTHGHKAGDEVLVTIADEADWLASVHRGILARLGGDEFLMVLPPSCARPDDVAETLRHRLSSRQDDAGRWSLSMGLATLSGEEDLDQGLHRADQALYRAKAAGRNRLAG